jgi:hypothetical protein
MDVANFAYLGLLSHTDMAISGKATSSRVMVHLANNNSTP